MTPQTDIRTGKDGRTPVVLVVEDEPMVREMIVEELTDLGFHVIEAETGEAGLDVLTGDAVIDVLFTDIRLPGALDGWHLAQAGRALSPDLRVVYATGYTVERSLQIAGSVFVTKPYRPSVIADTIRSLLAG
jgi:CheY-like chemotaxis protein